MKRILTILIAVLCGTLIIPGCEDKLEEKPKSILTPEFFSTAQGLQSGLNAAYAGTRLLWGSQDLFLATVPGTDEFSSGQDLGGSGLGMALYSSNFQANNGQMTHIWEQCYIFINTCSGLIDNAPEIEEITEATRNALVAEAKFLRANYYFTLVQFFGDVTLNTEFQTVPSTSAERHPMADVYDFIIDDLNAAITALPASPADMEPGKASAAAARHLLAKVYLTRASSPAAQTGDYNMAHTIAVNLINEKDALGLGLLRDFDNVHDEGNEDSEEVLWTVQHTTTLTHNGSEAQNSSDLDNVLNHMFVPQYDRQPGLVRSMEYGRPYIRVVPTRWLLDVAFQEKVDDSRYDKTFQTVWYANNEGKLPKYPDPLPALHPPGAVAGGVKFQVGDTAIYMPGRNVTAEEIETTRYFLIPPDPVATTTDPGKFHTGYAKNLSPAVTKYFDTKRAHHNNPSVRPVIVYRLAETYLVAAEALFMDGQASVAVDYINDVRRRAAYRAGNTPAENDAAAAAMEIAEGDLSIDFILDERSRELCGENTRWLDLVRTGKLMERVTAHNPEAAPNIQAPKHLLRPIPQDQIDAVITGTKYPQNPEW